MFYKIVKAFLWIFFKLVFFFDVENAEIIEGHNKRIVLCSNHSHFLDPLLLIAANKRPINFIAKKELFENKFLSFLLDKVGVIPIDREGLDRKALKRASEVLKDEKILGIFPEGTRIKNKEDISRDNFNNGIAMIANKDDANIIPVTIIGDFKPFKKMRVVYNEMVDIKKIEGINKKELYDNIVDEVYKKIYE